MGCIAEAWPATRVLVLTASVLAEDMLRSVGAGAAAYVLKLLSTGLSDHQTGLRLGVSTKTVASHLSSIRSKLRLRSRVEAAVLGQRLGLGRSS